MTRVRVGWIVGAVLALSPSPLLAQNEPAIPVRDLPAFPDLSSESEKVGEISVYGASLAEEEVVVGAAKREQSLGTVASAVTVIASDHLRRFGYRTLAEALRSVADVYIVDDRMVERVGIRGVQLLGDANTRILVLIDGSPLNEPWSQFVDGSTALPVQIDDVARIEVIRGPVSSIYGTNAFLGIINIVTLEADKAPPAYGRTSFDSYGTLGGNAGFGVGDVNHQVRGAVAFATRAGETVDYDQLGDAGLMSETSADGMQSLNGSLAVNYERLFFQARAYDRRRELPGAPYDSVVGSSDNQNRDRHFLAEIGYARDLTERISLAVRAYADRYQFQGDLLYDNPGSDTRPDGRFKTTGNSLWYGGELRALADILPDRRLSLTAGVATEFTATDSESSAVVNDAPVMVEVDKDFDIQGVYAEATSELTPWFAVTAGARYDRNSEFDNKLSPRAAVFLRHGEDYGLKLLFADGFRNPSIFEAFYNDGVRYSPQVQADGSTDLRPETIRSYEVVAYGRPLPGLKVRLSAWQWDMQDLLVKSAFVDPDLNPPAIRLSYQNQASLVSRGAEVEAAYRDVVGRIAYANAAVSFTGNSCIEDDSLFGNPFLDEETGNCNPSLNAPTLVAKAGASSQLLMKTFFLSTELSFIGARNTNDEDVEAGAWLGWNVVGFAPNVKGFDITIGLRNLFGREDVPGQSDYDRHIPRAGQTDQLVTLATVPGPGREVFARLGYRF
jgi:outer membrane receptor for ferrienterochelin and colicins